MSSLILADDLLMRRQGILLLRSYVCLYYAYTKLKHDLLSSTCIVVCQTDVLKCMLQKPILSGRIGEWAYALIEYDLACEFLRSLRGQIIADFIIEHRINDRHNL